MRVLKCEMAARKLAARDMSKSVSVHSRTIRGGPVLITGEKTNIKASV